MHNYGFSFRPLNTRNLTFIFSYNTCLHSCKNHFEVKHHDMFVMQQNKYDCKFTRDYA